MPTSGNVTFILNRNQIVEGALRILGQLAEGESPTAQQIIDGEISLNRMVKAWKAQDLHLWKYTEAILFLNVGQASYDFGGTTPSHATEHYVSMQLTVAAVATDTTITVDNATGVSANDQIGIALDSNVYHWTTVVGAPVANVITLASPIPSSAAVDNHVYSYTTDLTIPERITQARRFDDVAQPPLDVTINIVDRREYFQQTNKLIQGNPVQIYHDKQLTFGRVYIWPVADTLENKIKFTFQKPFDIFDSAGDSPDFPAEWEEALAFGLAVRLAPEYGVPMDERTYLKSVADEYLNNMLMYDREELSVYISPNLKNYQNDTN